MSSEPRTSPPPPIPSSPTLPSSRASTKLKRPPPITPKRFNRFFNPRSSQLSLTTSNTGRQLRDITNNGINRGSSAASGEIKFENLPNTRPRKRRKTNTLNDTVVLQVSEASILPSSSPPVCSSPCPDYLNSSPPEASRDYNDDYYTDEVEDELADTYRTDYSYPQSIVRARLPHVGARCENATHKFYSRVDEAVKAPNSKLPFCTTACHNESIIAIGDEIGNVSLLETNGDQNPPFSKPVVTFQPHKNSVMDLSFSSDDQKLATGSGDQTGRIIDVNTQTTILYLFEHHSSIKQVSFQPGNNNVVATCSRDGLVAIWDLRSQRPVNRIQLPGGVTVPDNARQASQYNIIAGGHANDAWTAFPRSKPGARRSDTNSLNFRDPSVTALQFLPQHSHLLLSASDASSILRLWDLRARYTNRKRDSNGTGQAGSPIPLALTAPLNMAASSKQRTPRSFGVSSLTLSTDGARTYSVCRDSSVYVYSTPHLILGSSPDTLSRSTDLNSKMRWAPSLGSAKGAGPLYALRNPLFKASSFYVKGAIRRTRDGLHDEILAVGSGTGSPILFPTDERTLRAQKPLDPSSKPLTNVASTAASVPIYETGTPLVEGHEREVTGVSWTNRGELVSVGDDRRVRLWREDENIARTLRTWRTGGRESRIGERIVSRSGWGWAGVSAEWDEDDG